MIFIMPVFYLFNFNYGKLRIIITIIDTLTSSLLLLLLSLTKQYLSKAIQKYMFANINYSKWESISLQVNFFFMLKNVDRIQTDLDLFGFLCEKK